MGFRIEDNCVGCGQGCISCGRKHQPAYFCDKCDDYCNEDNPLYIGDNGEELCWDCYKAQYTEKICDDMDDTLCAHCGKEAEMMYLVNGEWVCEDCLRNIAEKVDMED